MTNASDPEEHIANTPGNPYFMYSALYRFTPSDTVSLMESFGVATKVERGKRVFPVSDRAADVAEALLKYMKKNGARLHLEKTVRELTIKEGHITGLVLEDGKRIEADAVIVATGGLSFPKTGSTGRRLPLRQGCRPQGYAALSVACPHQVGRAFLRVTYGP